jgi:hypothetical protein
MQWLAKQSVEWRSAGIFEHQRHSVVEVRQRDWLGRPISVKLGLERIFVLEPFDRAQRRFFRGNNQDRRQAAAGAPVESAISLAQRRERVARKLPHEASCRRTLLY